MLSPSQVRGLRIRRLVAMARALIEAGVSTYLLFDKLDRASFRLWPGLRESTRRSYVAAALRAVLSNPPVASDLLTEAAPSQEAL